MAPEKLSKKVHTASLSSPSKIEVFGQCRHFLGTLAQALSRKAHLRRASRQRNCPEAAQEAGLTLLPFDPQAGRNTMTGPKPGSQGSL